METVSIKGKEMVVDIVGAHMANTIEKELGRDALVQTIIEGYQAFADTYNALVDEEMRILWKPEPKKGEHSSPDFGDDGIALVDYSYI